MTRGGAYADIAEDARDVENVVQDMSKNGHKVVANSIGCIRNSLAEEGKAPIRAHSLRGLTNLLDLLKPEPPYLGVEYDGLVSARWHLSDGSTLTVRFLNGGIVVFSVRYCGKSGNPIGKLTGTMPLARAAPYIGEFFHADTARGGRDGRGS